ncbi:MAG: hypothetical protein JOZ80_17175 [Acidobacteriaceae bacterium]|nr:hypothetical protein [Acidobacteriaceae bacterium]
MKKVMLISTMLLSSAMLAQDISIPAGTAMKVKLQNNLATYSSKQGDPFSGRVSEAVMVAGKAAIPVGATIEGRLTRVDEPRRYAGRPTIGIFPEALIMPNGERFMLNATLVDTSDRRGTDVNSEGQVKGRGHDGKDLTEIGMGTGGGMLIGGLAGGGKGLVIGGAVGATATVAHWLGKRKDAALPAGTELVMELSRPLEMKAEAGGQ